MKGKGYIYILTNPSFPEYVKIGYAADVKERLKQLNRSECIPFAFRVYATYEVDKALSDKDLHAMIDLLNPSLRAADTFDGKPRIKEFFEMSKEDAYRLLECVAKISGTEDGLMLAEPTQEEKDAEVLAEEIRSENKRPPFKFSMCGIQAGESVAFVRDENLAAVVVDDNHVEFSGEKYSLSALAQKFSGSKYPVQGPIYFTYKGQVLDSLRNKE